MSRRSVLACLWLGLGLALGFAAAGGERAAHANGRLPGTSSITFRQGNDNDIVAGLTFGLVVSHDGGKTWGWMCDDAIGINNGPYDPIYAYARAGTVFATTLAGLAVMRDGCTFASTTEGKAFVSTNALGPDAFYFGAAQTADMNHSVPADFQIYRSTDDGMTFPTPSMAAAPTDTNVWWQSIVVAPSDPQIVYLSGYRFVPDAGSAAKTVRDYLLFRSDDAGAHWTSLLPNAQLTLASNSVIHVVGVSPDDAKHVYLRIQLIDDLTNDALYLSKDSGATWTEIHRRADRFVGFVVRHALTAGKHDLVTATANFGTEVSHDDGMTWTTVAGAPHVGCLTENAAGELWACTQNYGVGITQSDDAGIMKTTDFTAWTKVLRYQDLTEAVSCPAGTPQHDSCAPMWCAVCAQLGCTPPASYACPVPGDDAAPPPAKKSGCCDTGAGAGGPLALALSVASLVLRPRRRLARKRSR
jgi:hypothetical protein